ncbi:MAG: radical SAM protein [Candidatus Marinimicrobia bacterium]|nr:radical SAM protein [Candidatus Neomarinimicrobiota bacterium]
MISKKKSPLRFIQIPLSELKRITQREINYYKIKPTHALLFITFRCTSRCRMCAMWKRGKNANIREELSLDEWKIVMDMLSELGVSIVEFFGGDALLRKDVLIPLIEYAHNKDIFTELPTNCNLLDKSTATRLVEAGLDVVWISLDGIGSTHDSVRGKQGTFEHVNEAIKNLMEAKNDNNTPKIMINCVISKMNLGNFEEIISYASEMNIEGIDFEYVGEIPSASILNSRIDGVIPTPFYISSYDSLLLNEKEAVFLKKKLAVLKETFHGNGKLRINTTKIDCLTTKDLTQGRFPNKRCYICRNIVTIDPYGNVMGCLHFNNYYFGNVRNETLARIWKNEKHHRFLKHQKRRKIQICDYCSNGVFRNFTPFQSFQSLYYEATGKSKS